MPNILTSTRVRKRILFEGSNCCEDFEWEDLCESITELMKEITEWYSEVANFGWRSVSGYKQFSANSGRELLQNILPNTDCNFKIHRYGSNGIAINNAHHDKPCGGEWYYIVPYTTFIERKINA